MVGAVDPKTIQDKLFWDGTQGSYSKTTGARPLFIAR
jgi:hypothetical protein